MITISGWLNRRAGAIKREIVRQLGAIKAIPYCAAYSRTTTFTPPAAFKGSDYPGLLAWHVVERSVGHEVISYWQDKEHYDYVRARFEDGLNLSGSLDWDGGVGDLHAKDPSWWPSYIKEAIVAVAAVIGAAGVIWTAAEKGYELSWATPQLAVSFASPEFNVTEGQRTQIAITITNSGFVPVELDTYAQLVGRSGSPQAVTLDRSVVSTVDKNGSVPSTATFIAPRLESVVSAAADYTLSVNVSAQTWRFRKPKPFPATTVPVTVWPRSFGWTNRLEHIPESNPRVYHAAGYVYSGALLPSGLHATVSFEGPKNADLVVELPDFRTSPQAVSPSPPVNGKRTFSWDFDSRALEKYEKRRFEIRISPKPGQAPPNDWASVANSLRIQFYQ